MSWIDVMTEIAVTAGTLLLMGLFVALSVRYFRKIGRREADPLVDPSWPTNMRPASPPSPLFASDDGELNDTERDHEDR